MKKQNMALLIILWASTTLSLAQNLPSLLSGKNINSTFSILAYDENAKEWGIAVATDNIYVGNSTIYIQPGLGAFSVIAETNPQYGLEGLEKLKAGQSIEQAISEVRDNDKNSNYRQVSGIDADGNVFAFTGQSLKYWQGHASEISGKNHVVIGNQLSTEVLISMSKTFERATGTLAQRLLESLIAGQNAGGQISGKQSAAVVVKGVNNEWYNQIDLRVDNSNIPFSELQTLMDYHYGRITLNQALNAHHKGRKKTAKLKLKEAESMLDGWTGIYSKIAIAHVLIHNQDSAVDWVLKGLKDNPNWTVNIPAFYFLKNHPKLKSIIKPNSFGVKDWESALSMLSQLGRETAVIELSKKLKQQNIESSYLNFLLGRSYFYEKDQNQAVMYLEKSLVMDKENIEAQNLLNQIKTTQ